MHVKLVSYTPDPERTCAVAAYASTHEKLNDKMFKELDRKKVEKVLRNVISRGHLSVVEHASFTFNISGVSRALTHELVRHRMASYTQQSQRYVRVGEENYVIPKTIKSNQTLLKTYKEIIQESFKVYKKLLNEGIPPEDARYVLPNATHTSIVVTMNARSLLHFFTLRCCNRAQWEIRKLADTMLVEVKKVAPVIFEKAGPPCVRGPCPEGKFACGKPRSNEPLFASAKKN